MNNPDRFRANDQAVRFVKAFTSTGRPVAAICHGPWTLIEAALIVVESENVVILRSE
jgi:protease I